MKNLMQRLHELQKNFPRPLPVSLVITKCDLLPGFEAFFSESSQNEIMQIWGISLTPTDEKVALTDLFAGRFNGLIKKLNQQLLWRMHQERNPLQRPLIKDFPLQVERLKEFTLSFIKTFQAHRPPFLSLTGVYLTSALQPVADTAKTVLAQSSQPNKQLLKEPITPSRAYFIRQLISEGLLNEFSLSPHPKTINRFKQPLAYAASFAFIALPAWLLCKVFREGVKHAYAIQATLSDYRQTTLQIENPLERLVKTLALLNTLQQSAAQSNFKIDLSYLLTFYSHQAQQKAGDIYRQTLQTKLLPDIKYLLEEYLENPVNKDDNRLYTSLKAYLMLHEPLQTEAAFVADTLQGILKTPLSDKETAELIFHIRAAFHYPLPYLPSDDALIQQTRQFLASRSTTELGYIILKNNDPHHQLTEINLAPLFGESAALLTHPIDNQVPRMFTAQAFSQIISESIAAVVHELTHPNWVLGEAISKDASPEATLHLLDELRHTYVSHYVAFWERLIANLELMQPDTLAQTDALVANLSSEHSPLLVLLQTLHENTFFEPIASLSPKLQRLNLLINNRTAPDSTMMQD